MEVKIQIRGQNSNLRSKSQISGHNYKFEVKISNLSSLFKIWGQHSNLRSKFKFKVKIQIWGHYQKFYVKISNLRSKSEIWAHFLIFEVTIQNLRSRFKTWGQKFLLIPEPIIADISVFGRQSCRFLCRLTSIKISNSALLEFSFIKSKGKSDVDSNEFPGFFEDLKKLIRLKHDNFSQIFLLKFFKIFPEFALQALWFRDLFYSLQKF